MKLSLSSFFLISSLPFMQAASIRGSRNLANCGVTGFSYYTFDQPYEVTKPLYSVLDMTDVQGGKVNIIANVGEPCGTEPIMCVKLSFAGDTRKERVAPYSLYGDKPGSHFHRSSPKESGKQLLEAWTYTDRDCTEGESGYKSMEVDVIPADEPLEGTVALDAFTVTYEGTMGPATEDETSVAGQATCDFFSQAFGYGMFYKADISLTDFSCDYSVIDGDDPLAIEFDISASFQKSTGFNPYVNHRLPTAEEIEGFVLSLVEKNVTLGFFGPSLISYINRKVTTGPYASVTGFALV